MKNNVPILQLLAPKGEQTNDKGQDPGRHNLKAKVSDEERQELSSLEIFRKACGLGSNQNIVTDLGRVEDSKNHEVKNSSLSHRKDGENTTKQNGKLCRDSSCIMSPW